MDKDLIERFFSTFAIITHSMASQVFEITPEGTTSYDDTEVYGETASLDIMWGGDVIGTVIRPIKDEEVVMAMIRAWGEAGCPLPSDNPEFFNTQL